MTNLDTASSRPGKSPLQWGDTACLTLFVLILLTTSYLRSRHRMFWGDEIMGLLVLRQPSWAALLHAWKAGLDSSGIWFYVFGRPWIHIFGASEVSLREYSAVGVAASAVVLWITARRYYSMLTVAAAVCFTYVAVMSLRWQLSNGRAYGILMLACTLVVYLISRGEEQAQATPTPLFLLATFAAYALLAGSHVLGVVYVSTFLATQIVLDLVQRRPRPWLYLAAACSSVVVLFSLANLKATAALGKPSFWTVRPTLKELLTGSAVFGGRRVGLLVVLLLVFSALRLRVVRERIPVYIVLIGFFCLDLFMFAYSQIATSIYVDRYLVPFALAAVLLLCELFTQAQAALARWPWIALAPAVIVLLIGFRLLVHPPGPPGLPIPDYTGSLLAALPPKVPAVDSDTGSYVEMEFYHQRDLKVPFLVPVDWPLTHNPAFRGGVSGFHELDNFKAAGWYANGILPSATILSQEHDFTVITGEDELWFETRIVADPRFRVSPCGVVRTYPVRFHLWCVHTN